MDNFAKNTYFREKMSPFFGKTSELAAGSNYKYFVRPFFHIK